MKNQLKIVVFLSVVFAAARVSNAQDLNPGGKTFYYYDEATKQKVKEIFHYIEILKIIRDPYSKNEYLDTIIHVKNGPYAMYHENGKLAKTGFYKNGAQDSLWKYYDIKGEVERKELYRNGKLVE